MTHRGPTTCSFAGIQRASVPSGGFTQQDVGAGSTPSVTPVRITSLRPTESVRVPPSRRRASSPSPNRRFLFPPNQGTGKHNDTAVPHPNPGAHHTAYRPLLRVLW